MYRNLAGKYFCYVQLTVCYASAGDCSLSRLVLSCMRHSGVYTRVDYTAQVGHLCVVVFITLGFV